MLKIRQSIVHACPPFPNPVTTLSHEFSDNHEIPVHFHPEDQLVYASHGIMTVRTKDGTWVVPPKRAVWIPAGRPHGITMSGKVSMRTLYLKPRLVRRLSKTCRVVNVSVLLKELIIHACKYSTLKRRIKTQAHLIDILVDQLEVIETSPLHLPTPSDARALRIAEALAADPSDQRPLQEICKLAGASKRTLERIFLLETQMTLGEWRQQLRLLRSMQLLAAGEKMTHVALETGYSTPSAFIAMFKKALGKTPGQFFQENMPAHSPASIRERGSR